VRIVLDTNVVVSALLWHGAPYGLIRAAVDGTLTLCTSAELLAELREVLGREHLFARLDLQSSSVDEALALYGGLALSVVPTSVPGVVRADPDVDHVIATAVAAKADLIVSGDHHLLDIGLHKGIRIVTPAEAARMLAAV
jgi:putative PIN family toxin of toxin-antitoxin system